MNAAPSLSVAHLPRATTLLAACALQARYSGGRAGPHVIVLEACSAEAEEYFVVTPGEAARLYAAGYEPLWKR